ncbi:MAG: hypothetical protein A4E73_00901 [Syntrophaceae bacterium PtaU1.Bin231]|nr:MAG: hypothetical protein A4E73_00901 [Syntrophaceae bacterium PtaU1.Bin231]
MKNVFDVTKSQGVLPSMNRVGQICYKNVAGEGKKRPGSADAIEVSSLNGKKSPDGLAAAGRTVANGLRA